MSNPFDEMRAAISNAEATMEAADNAANDMVTMLRGRLRKVGCWRLVELKRELQQFDAHKKEWKS